MEGVIALRLSYLVETYSMLPSHHYGGRKGQGCDTALHAVTEAIRSAWKCKKIASLLLLDISGAFDNVSHIRLLHNLHRRRVPTYIVNWIKSFLSDRYTTLELPEYSHPREAVHTGIPQGSPLSPILYLFYNADLMGRKQYTTNFGYIDDTSILATSNSTRQNCQLLAKAFEHCDNWAAKHASVFAPEKFALVHFPPPKADRNDDRDDQAEAYIGHVDLGNGRTIRPSLSAKLLGVVIDGKLTFEDHIKEVDKKCTKSLQAISALGRSKWGLKTDQKRLIYNACIAPKALYAASVWMQPHEGKKATYKAQLRRLTAIQRRAAHSISGAFRTVSADALNAQLYLQPMERLPLLRTRVYYSTNGRNRTSSTLFTRESRRWLATEIPITISGLVPRYDPNP